MGGFASNQMIVTFDAEILFHEQAGNLYNYFVCQSINWIGEPVYICQFQMPMEFDTKSGIRSLYHSPSLFLSFPLPYLFDL